ncbi:MAG: efflux RND transporter periplasmic adaptor subunit [Acidobacteriia bacterium]|nr:efflux RND transporter periplasmic adaptor subunit [Terriglobia bacterium]
MQNRASKTFSRQYQGAARAGTGTPWIWRPRACRFCGSLFALLLIFVPGCSKQDPKPAAATALNVKTIQLEPRALEEFVDVTGSLVSSVAVDVKTEFAGRIIALRKQEGDAVSQGELLAQLDDANARLSVGQAHANLEVAQAALDRMHVAEEHAKTEQERAQNLLRSGGITDKDLLAAQMASRDAHAQVKLGEAQVEQAKQSLQMAQKHLNDCRIISPIAGTVERKPWNPGSYVDVMAIVYRLVDNQRLELESLVASSDIGRIAKGQVIRFGVAAFPGEEFTATLLTISSGVQTQNRSLPVRAAVPNPSGKLKAGMFAKGRIVVGKKLNALVVPADAIWRRTGEPPFVYIVEQDQARKREVRLGLEQSNTIEVAQGLKPGERVVVEQNLELAEGVRIAAGKK